MAGAGVKPGFSYGETDDFGYNLVKDPFSVHDLQAIMLHLLGIDHERLTFKHPGKRYRLTDMEGEVVKGIFLENIPCKGGINYVLYQFSQVKADLIAMNNNYENCFSYPCSQVKADL